MKAGDRVTLVNDYGVKFPGKTLRALDTPWPNNPEPRWFVEPTDTPWFSFPERQLIPESTLEVK